MRAGGGAARARAASRLAAATAAFAWSLVLAWILVASAPALAPGARAEESSGPASSTAADAAPAGGPAHPQGGATRPGASTLDRDESAGWVVVVHPSNPSRRMGRSELERIYRRRTLFWPDGRAIQPLHLDREDERRRAFTRSVLRSDEDELATWWNRQYYQGTRPPAVLHSSAAVRAYVAATPAAIGYLPPSEVDASVAVVEVLDGR